MKEEAPKEKLFLNAFDRSWWVFNATTLGFMTWVLSAMVWVATEEPQAMEIADYTTSIYVLFLMFFLPVCAIYHYLFGEKGKAKQALFLGIAFFVVMLVCVGVLAEVGFEF